jgi:hypothetical protein
MHHLTIAGRGEYGSPPAGGTPLGWTGSHCALHQRSLTTRNGRCSAAASKRLFAHHTLCPAGLVVPPWTWPLRPAASSRTRAGARSLGRECTAPPPPRAPEACCHCQRRCRGTRGSQPLEGDAQPRPPWRGSSGSTLPCSGVALRCAHRTVQPPNQTAECTAEPAGRDYHHWRALHEHRRSAAAGAGRVSDRSSRGSTDTHPGTPARGSSCRRYLPLGPRTGGRGWVLWGALH